MSRVNRAWAGATVADTEILLWDPWSRWGNPKNPCVGPVWWCRTIILFCALFAKVHYFVLDLFSYAHKDCHFLLAVGGDSGLPYHKWYLDAVAIQPYKLLEVKIDIFKGPMPLFVSTCPANRSMRYGGTYESSGAEHTGPVGRLCVSQLLL